LWPSRGIRWQPPRFTPGTKSATSPLPTWWKPFTAAWPTTPSAGSSNPCWRVDLISLDELGVGPLDDTGTQPLFRLVAGAYERRSLAIGSHWPFEQWDRFLPEQTNAVSILDRLLHHATVVITDGDSYRMKDAQHRKGNPQPT
jgi:hypothetical protein